MIKYPSKYKEVFFCNIRFDHTSTRGGSHGDLHERGWIHHASAVRWDQWCTETSFFHTIKPLNPSSFLRDRRHECNESLIYGWGIKREHPRMSAWKTGITLTGLAIYLPDRSVSSCLACGCSEVARIGDFGENMSPFICSAWVSLTDTSFLLITPPTRLQLQCRIWHRINVSGDCVEQQLD